MRTRLHRGIRNGLLLSIPIWLLMWSVCFGATFYVTTTGSGAACTQEAPCGTLSQAQTTASANDTVIVGAGTYDGTYSAFYGFNLNKNLTWQANGTVILTAAVATASVIRFITGTAYTMRGFTISGADKQLVYVAGIASISVDECDFVFTNSEGNSHTCILIANNTTLSVDDSTFTIAASRGSGIRTASTKTGSITLTGNTVNIAEVYSGSYFLNVSNGTWAVTATGNTGTIADNTNSTADEVFFYCLNQVAPTLTGNTITSASTASYTHIVVASAGTECGIPVITGNTLGSHSYGGYIVRIGTDATGAGDNKFNSVNFSGNILRGPLSYDLGLIGEDITIHGLLCGFLSNASVQRNQIDGNYYGVVLKGDSGTSPYSAGGVHYNTLKNNRQAVHIKGIEGATSYNNSIYIGFGVSGAGYNLVSFNGGDPAATKIKNNIIWSDSESYADHNLITNDSNDLTGFESDYNCLYKTNYTGRVGTLQTVVKTLAEWQALGYDAHSVALNPLFQSTIDFRLRPNSPARNAGADLGDDYDIDFDGNDQDRYGRGWEIGAHVFKECPVAVLGW